MNDFALFFVVVLFAVLVADGVILAMSWSYGLPPQWRMIAFSNAVTLAIVAASAGFAALLVP